RCRLQALVQRVHQRLEFMEGLVVAVLGEDADDAPRLVAHVGLAGHVFDLAGLVVVFAQVADVLVQRADLNLVAAGAVHHASSSIAACRRAAAATASPSAVIRVAESAAGERRSASSVNVTSSTAPPGPATTVTARSGDVATTWSPPSSSRIPSRPANRSSTCW